MKPQGSARIALPLALGLISAVMFILPERSPFNAVLLGIMAPLPVMIASLGLGLLSAVLAGFVGAVACGVVAGWPLGVSFFAMAGFPAVLIAALALRHSPQSEGEVLVWYPVGRIAAWITACGFVLLGVFLVLLAHQDGGYRGVLEDNLGQVLDVLGDQVAPSERTDIIQTVIAIMPSLVTGLWMFIVVVNAMTAQALLSWTGQSLRPTPDYLGLVLPKWVIIFPVAAVVMWGAAHGMSQLDGNVVWGDMALIGANGIAIAMLPFAALGTALVHHRITREKQFVTLGLMAFYAALMFFSVWVLVPLAVVGLVKFVRVWIFRPRVELMED